MVWYISEFGFETTPKKLGELEKIISDGKIRFDLPVSNDEGYDDSSSIKLIEGKNSSFLRQSEDYFLFVDYCGIISYEDDIDDITNYDFGIHVGSINSDTKQIVTEKIKNYFTMHSIKFKEEEY